ncbi:MAG TPA: DUF5996 family protein, partial [Candidatus Baltobacteraceae bacterium]|nr:DUF5996 family protein [Candidatus Baltobacteraceae bacterium]
GNGLEASLYAYAYPEPPGFAEAKVRPDAAGWHRELREFLLPYESVRTSDDPDEAVLSFFRSTFESGASLARWDESLHR